MSMSVCYITATKEKFEEIKSGKLDFSDYVESNRYTDSKEIQYMDLDFYARDFMDYLYETGNSLGAIFSYVEPLSILQVDAGGMYDEEGLEIVLDSFNDEDLLQVASEIEYSSQDENDQERFYGFLVGMKEYFEYAKANNLVIITWMI
ncbi:hypothetical protein [Moraxella sp. ZY210820]|uniref:hypothetical protein n=1 Tax=unclassified Moraxella TaxID=2685852 RepID=UPI002731F720|nr:hypothetical protein [Moraxella sp. ZY210820]WLF84560.1 hypothetical protein LU301_03540 [Moraxella sp. ZY210820]